MSVVIDLKIRKISEKDIIFAEEIISKIKEFNEKDRRVCLDVFRQIEKDEYEGIGVFNGDKFLGFILFSENSLSEGVIDLLWIVVDPEFQGTGLAEVLFIEFSNEIRRRNARVIVLETSERHARARGFYRKMGFEKEAEIKDFYRTGESKEIWVKRF